MTCFCNVISSRSIDFNINYFGTEFEFVLSCLLRAYFPVTCFISRQVSFPHVFFISGFLEGQFSVSRFMLVSGLCVEKMKNKQKIYNKKQIKSYSEVLIYLI